MKRREIQCLLAGCILLLTPLQARADELSDVLSEASIDVLGYGQNDILDPGAADSLSENRNPLSSTVDSLSENRDPLSSAADSISGNRDPLSSAADSISENKNPADGALAGTSDTAAETAGPEETAGTDGTEAAAPEETAESGQVSDEMLLEPIGVDAILEATKTEKEYAEAYEKAKNANWGYTNLGIANVDNNLNIRAAAAEDGKLVGKLPKNAACEVLDDDGTWAHIKSGKVEGYVSLDYLFTGITAKHKAEELATTMARVTTDSLKVRAEASTESEVVTLVPNGEELEVISVEGDWVKVYLDDEEVYVHADYVEVSSELDTAITMTELLYGQGVSDIRVDICQYAKEFLGNPYVWGGTSLTKGADCSGFVQGVFKKYGVRLPRTSREQANSGTTVSLSEVKAGDLIFYGNGRHINHVAIYIGGGQVIHASNRKTGIKISNMTYRSPVKAVRVLYD